MDPSATPSRSQPRALADETLEHVVGGAGVIPPAQLRDLLASAGTRPQPADPTGA